jgi:hypothetical protein
LSAAGLAGLAAAYLAAGSRYPLDTWATPGPGVFPLAAGIAMLILAGGQALFSARGPARAAEPAPRRAGKPPLMIGLLGLYVASLSVLGFLAASFGLVILAARLMGAPGWMRPGLLALGVTIAAWVVFVIWLGVPLP